MQKKQGETALYRLTGIARCKKEFLVSLLKINVNWFPIYKIGAFFSDSVCLWPIKNFPTRIINKSAGATVQNNRSFINS